MNTRNELRCCLKRAIIDSVSFVVGTSLKPQTFNSSDFIRNRLQVMGHDFFADCHIIYVRILNINPLNGVFELASADN